MSESVCEPPLIPWEGSAAQRWAADNEAGWAAADDAWAAALLDAPEDTAWLDGTWLDDHPADDHAADDPRPDDEVVACTDDEAGADGAPGWAVPGLDENAGEHGERGGGLSGAAAAALAEAAAAWTVLRRAQARCYRAMSGLTDSGAVSESGYRNLTRLLGDHVNLDAAEARRLTRHAASLAATVSPTGTAVAPDLPATAREVDAGAIGPGHVEVIRNTVGRLERVLPEIDPATLATTEAELAMLATTHTPSALSEAAATILTYLHPDGTAPRDDRPPENELHYQQRRNGDLVGKFTYRDPVAAQLLTTALAAATPPPPGAGLHPDLTEPGQRGEDPETTALRTLPERRAHALLDLATEALTRGLDHPEPDDNADEPTLDDDESTLDDRADSGGEPTLDDPADHDPADGGPTGLFPDDLTDGPPPAATDPPPPTAAPDPPEPPRWLRPDIEGGEHVALTVTLDYDALRSQITDLLAGNNRPPLPPRLALLGENTWIRPETARRLACDADLVPAVLATHGEPLDIGRRHRIVPLALRRALALRDRHCAHPGCRRRARRTHAHHITHWAHGGDTALDNLVLLCGYHHALHHHSDWQIHITDGLPWFVPPAWLDLRQRPRHNRPWQATVA